MTEEVDWALAGAMVHRDAVTPAVPETIGIRDGRVAFVGSDQELRARFGAAVPTRRLPGAHVYPGFEDAHGHLHSLGMSLEEVRLEETRSLAEALDRVRIAALRLVPDAWLTGGGWDESLWEERRLPTAADLTVAAGGRPVFLSRRDHHAAWVSEAALAAAGLGSVGADPNGGRIVRDDAGRPSGVLVDRAMDLVRRHLPEPGPEVVRRRVLRALKACIEVGITAVHDMGVDARTLAALRGMDREHSLPLRVYAALADDPALWEAELARGPQIPTGASRLTVRAVKLFADGALGSRGAALFDDYADDPGNRGFALLSGPELAERLTRATRAGFQCCVHAIGDRANREVLDAFEALGRGPDGVALAGLRPRIEHAQVLAAEDVPRFAAVGVIASMQPVHAAADQRWADARLGADRARHAYAWSSLHRAHARLCFGSDFPVESFDPRDGLVAARTRSPLGGDPGASWLPEQQVDTAVAVAAYTSGAAHAAFADSERGRIAEGMVADFTIWDRDLAGEPASLREARVLATIVAGRIEHAAAPIPLG